MTYRADAVEESCRHERVRTDACGCRRQERAHDGENQSTAQHPLGAEFHRQHTTDDLRQHVAPEKRTVDGAAQVAIPVELTSLKINVHVRVGTCSSNMRADLLSFTAFST